MDKPRKKIETKEIKDWRVASKTKPIKAKPLISVLVDKKVTNQFLLSTIEGKEVLGDGSLICIGEAGDAWQQMPNKLLAKYTVTAIDGEGWMVCEPRPDNAVDVIEVTPALCGSDVDFYIIGQWGATIGDEKNVQTGVVGDFICRNRTDNDNDDVWIVHRKLFLNTYNIKS